SCSGRCRLRHHFLICFCLGGGGLACIVTRAARLALATLILASGTARGTLAAAGSIGFTLALFHSRQVAIVPFDRLPDQLLDRIDVFRIVARRDGERLAEASGAAGA